MRSVQSAQSVVCLDWHDRQAACVKELLVRLRGIQPIWRNVKGERVHCALHRRKTKGMGNCYGKQQRICRIRHGATRSSGGNQKPGDDGRIRRLLQG